MNQDPYAQKYAVQWNTLKEIVLTGIGKCNTMQKGCREKNYT